MKGKRFGVNRKGDDTEGGASRIKVICMEPRVCAVKEILKRLGNNSRHPPMITFVTLLPM